MAFPSAAEVGGLVGSFRLPMCGMVVLGFRMDKAGYGEREMVEVSRQY